MVSEDNTSCGRKRSNPSHEDWQFRNEAVIWNASEPMFPNVYPVANELRSWMLQQSQLTFLAHVDKTKPNAPTNPYTYNAYLLAVAIAEIINEANSFAIGRKKLDSSDAEIRYIRLYSELLLYTARLCEVLVKQLLYCTDFLEDQYQNAALGALMSDRCRGCQRNNKRHFVSLLGSLAHKYHLCHSYENCLHGKMTIINHQRNSEAAHSGVAEFHGRSVKESRVLMKEKLSTVGNELIHMLNHIGDLEAKIITQLRLDIRLHRTEAIEVRFPFGDDPSKPDEKAIHEK